METVQLQQWKQCSCSSGNSAVTGVAAVENSAEAGVAAVEAVQRQGLQQWKRCRDRGCSSGNGAETGVSGVGMMQTMDIRH